MKCINCDNLKSHGGFGQKMAKQGFGGCSKAPVYETFSLTRERDCAMYTPAPAEKVAQRARWLA